MGRGDLSTEITETLGNQIHSLPAGAEPYDRPHAPPRLHRVETQSYLQESQGSISRDQYTPGGLPGFPRLEHSILHQEGDEDWGAVGDGREETSLNTRETRRPHPVRGLKIGSIGTDGSYEASGEVASIPWEVEGVQGPVPWTKAMEEQYICLLGDDGFGEDSFSTHSSIETMDFHGADVV